METEEETVVLRVSRSGGEVSGEVELRVSTITKLGRIGDRTSVDFEGGLIYVTDPDRTIEAMLHRFIANALDAAAQEAFEAAQREHRIS